MVVVSIELYLSQGETIFCFSILGIEDEKESAFHFLYNCVECCSGADEEQNIHIW